VDFPHCAQNADPTARHSGASASVKWRRIHKTLRRYARLPRSRLRNHQRSVSSGERSRVGLRLEAVSARVKDFTLYPPVAVSRSGAPGERSGPKRQLFPPDGEALNSAGCANDCSTSEERPLTSSFCGRGECAAFAPPAYRAADVSEPSAR